MEKNVKNQGKMLSLFLDGNGQLPEGFEWGCGNLLEKDMVFAGLPE
jgi:hypothetical protein